MLIWLQQNIWTIVICAVLALVVFMIIRSMIRNKKAGKSSCGCGCANCAMKGECHKK